jgi:hypothetical protein
MMSANSDVERELSMLKGELTTGAPKQLEGSGVGANGQTQAEPRTQQGPQGSQPTQQAGVPAAEPQDGEGA